MRGLIVGIVCVFALFFAGGFLASACDLRPEFENAIPPMLLVVMACAVIFPTGRKRGGCWLGCGLWFVGGMGLLAAGSFFPHAPLSRPVTHEAAPVPRYLNGVTPTVDGVSLGMSEAQVTALWGPPTGKGLAGSSFPHGRRVSLANGVVTRVSGRLLAQDGRELVHAGDLLDRASQVLQPGISIRTIFRREGYTFVLVGEGSRVESISLSRGD